MGKTKSRKKSVRTTEKKYPPRLKVQNCISSSENSPSPSPEPSLEIPSVPIKTSMTEFLAGMEHAVSLKQPLGLKSTLANETPMISKFVPIAPRPSPQKIVVFELPKKELQPEFPIVLYVEGKPVFRQQKTVTGVQPLLATNPQSAFQPVPQGLNHGENGNRLQDLTAAQTELGKIQTAPFNPIQNALLLAEPQDLNYEENSRFLQDLVAAQSGMGTIQTSPLNQIRNALLLPEAQGLNYGENSRLLQNVIAAQTEMGKIQTAPFNQIPIQSAPFNGMFHQPILPVIDPRTATQVQSFPTINYQSAFRPVPQRLNYGENAVQNLITAQTELGKLQTPLFNPYQGVTDYGMFHQPILPVVDPIAQENPFAQMALRLWDPMNLTPGSSSSNGNA